MPPPHPWCILATSYTEIDLSFPLFVSRLLASEVDLSLCALYYFFSFTICARLGLYLLYVFFPSTICARRRGGEPHDAADGLARPSQPLRRLPRRHPDRLADARQPHECRRR